MSESAKGRKRKQGSGVVLMSRLREGSLGPRLAVLTVVMTLACGLTLPIAWWHSTQSGVIADLLAAGVCWVGAAFALVLNGILRATGTPLLPVFGGMLVRMVPALTAAIAARYFARGLAEAGFLVYLVVFFELALLLEIGLLTPFENNTAPPK